MTARLTRRQALRLCAAPFALSAAAAWAQSGYPEKPIRIVVGYPPGQNLDTVARNFAALMSKELGQSIYIDNRPGANGIIGAQEVKRSAPDGYSLLFASSGQLAINPSLYKKLPYDPVRDFVPISLGGTGALYLVANPAFPPNNVAEFIAYAKERPGKLDFASGGNGITAHLAMELFQAQAGIELHHIPYKGSPDAVNALIGGQVPVMFEPGATVLPQIKAGRLKVLGVSSAKRNPQNPGIPTIAEQGLKDFEVTAWLGLLAPAGTPEPIVAKLNAAMRKVAASPVLIDSMHNGGTEPGTTTSAQFGSFLQSEIKKWNVAVTRAGVQLD